MTTPYRLLTKSGHTLTDWHFDSFDGPRVWGERLDGWSDEALQNIERHVARVSFEWSESPSKLVH